MTTLKAYADWLTVHSRRRLDDARQRAAEEGEQGEIVEKVIIVAAAAAIAIGAMAAIAAAVDLKIGGLQL